MTEIICIPNIQNYNHQIIDGDLILTPKPKYITEDELNIIPITNSTIEECIIKHGDETISINLHYRPILIDIWKSMPTQKILQTTTFNFRLTDENGKKGSNSCFDYLQIFTNDIFIYYL